MGASAPFAGDFTSPYTGWYRLELGGGFAGINRNPYPNEDARTDPSPPRASLSFVFAASA